MSLQPGINPLEAVSMDEDRKRLERTMAARKFRQGMEDRQRIAERTRTAMEFRDNMAQGIPNMGGFDPGDLMAAPKLRQDATMNQANMVSSPYFEANEKAAEKTNPMNAASQEPGRSFLMKYIGK
tara:strand:- start:236 stop:610 length:375 start_codon:yes stop_codon:yes gene_type:complete